MANDLKERLRDRGVKRVMDFCRVNNLRCPKITTTPLEDWHVSACAYYRPDTEGNRKWTSPGINICLRHCAWPATELQARNWNWPGSVTDREPYGVLCHELGHHADWSASNRKWRYYGDYSEQVMKASGEPAITSYAPDPSEWFAEIFRLFVTNPQLLRAIRPTTHAILRGRWEPVEKGCWKTALGPDVPDRIINNLQKKVDRANS